MYIYICAGIPTVQCLKNIYISLSLSVITHGAQMIAAFVESSWLGSPDIPQARLELFLPGVASVCEGRVGGNLRKYCRGLTS